MSEINISTREKVNKVFIYIQSIDLHPTTNNMALLNGCFSLLREIDTEVAQKESEAAEWQRVAMATADEKAELQEKLDEITKGDNDQEGGK